MYASAESSNSLPSYDEPPLAPEASFQSGSCVTEVQELTSFIPACRFSIAKAVFLRATHTYAEVVSATENESQLFAHAIRYYRTDKLKGLGSPHTQVVKQQCIAPRILYDKDVSGGTSTTLLYFPQAAFALHVALVIPPYPGWQSCICDVRANIWIFQKFLKGRSVIRYQNVGVITIFILSALLIVSQRVIPELIQWKPGKRHVLPGQTQVAKRLQEFWNIRASTFTNLNLKDIIAAAV
ncbi:uncharacterized protein BT62DRAFT_919757 [Guyanagaster necrorhizus]|uniref:Uncharacterized protein n=1 Tax=Guyanagaster necrorhizus TaxID=856835 RepID=A0A9P7VU34_9AGAR|nr:uncharacterized protein BT62DRAFT_919757 [Guyanagaster necrorhizus MCA 3950]KAG7446475.1 hypothetical protein BT62DRAFT_919757 [Guyanagaster necrorhizus MCA 3950]